MGRADLDGEEGGQGVSPPAPARSQAFEPPAGIWETTTGSRYPPPTHTTPCMFSIHPAGLGALPRADAFLRVRECGR